MRVFLSGEAARGRAWDRRRAKKGAEHIRFFGVACCPLRCLCGRACVGEGHAHGPNAYGPVLCGRLCAQCPVRIALWAPRAPYASLWGAHFVLAAASVSRFYRGRGRERRRVVRDCSGGGWSTGCPRVARASLQLQAGDARSRALGRLLCARHIMWLSGRLFLFVRVLAALVVRCVRSIMCAVCYGPAQTALPCHATPC